MTARDLVKIGYSREYAEYAEVHQFCEVCGRPARKPHHIRTRGRWGNVDDHRNLLSLCELHDTSLEGIHGIGPRSFARAHPVVAKKIEVALGFGADELEEMKTGDRMAARDHGTAEKEAAPAVGSILQDGER